jgi:serine/threonine protein kinase
MLAMLVEPHQVVEGIPNVYDFFYAHCFHGMVMELLGRSVYDIMMENPHRRLSIQDVLELGRHEVMFVLCFTRHSTQCGPWQLRVLRHVHQVGHIIHRDLRPDNMLIADVPGAGGNGAYLADYGLAKKYEPEAIPRHESFVGTITFASVNAHHSIEQSYRDDLEALANVLIYLACGTLPWEHIGRTQGLAAALALKQQAWTTHQFCVDLPPVFISFREKTRKLGFNEIPEYEKHIAQFTKARTSMGHVPVYLQHGQTHSGANTQRPGPARANSVPLPAHQLNPP